MPNYRTLDACLGKEILDMIEKHGPLIAASIKLDWSNRNFDYDSSFTGTRKEKFYNEVVYLSEQLNNPTILEDINRKENEYLFLVQGYSEDEFNAFMKRAHEYYYDSGYGLDDIDGVVYCENGTYYIHEYDGSTGWNFIPKPPETLEEAEDVFM